MSVAEFWFVEPTPADVQYRGYRGRVLFVHGD